MTVVSISDVDIVNVTLQHGMCVSVMKVRHLSELKGDHIKFRRAGGHHRHVYGEPKRNGTVAVAKRGVAKRATTTACPIRQPFKNAVISGGTAVGKNESIVKVIRVAAPVFDGALFAYSWYKAHKKYRNAVKSVGNNEIKKRLEQQRDKEIREAFCEAVGAVVGGAALGAAMSSVDRGSVLGTATCALIGSFGGRLLGRALNGCMGSY